MNRILIDNRQRIYPIDGRRLRGLILRLLRLAELEDQEISLVFTDDAGIREINRSYLGRDYPTNVIAFAQNEGDSPNPHPQLLGDVVVSVERARDDAREASVPVEEELIFLIIHGILHLLGYDHERDDEKEAERMRKKEVELFQKLRGYRLSSPR